MQQPLSRAPVTVSHKYPPSTFDRTLAKLVYDSKNNFTYALSKEWVSLSNDSKLNLYDKALFLEAYVGYAQKAIPPTAELLASFSAWMIDESKKLLNPALAGRPRERRDRLYFICMILDAIRKLPLGFAIIKHAKLNPAITEFIKLLNDFKVQYADKIEKEELKDIVDGLQARANAIKASWTEQLTTNRQYFTEDKSRVFKEFELPNYPTCLEFRDINVAYGQITLPGKTKHIGIGGTAGHSIANGNPSIADLRNKAKAYSATLSHGFSTNSDADDVKQLHKKPKVDDLGANLAQAKSEYNAKQKGKADSVEKIKTFERTERRTKVKLMDHPGVQLTLAKAAAKHSKADVKSLDSRSMSSSLERNANRASLASKASEKLKVTWSPEIKTALFDDGAPAERQHGLIEERISIIRAKETGLATNSYFAQRYKKEVGDEKHNRITSVLYKQPKSILPKEIASDKFFKKPTEEEQTQKDRQGRELREQYSSERGNLDLVPDGPRESSDIQVHDHSNAIHPPVMLFNAN